MKKRTLSSQNLEILMTFLTSSKIKKKMVRKNKRTSKRKSTKRKLRKMKPSGKKKMKETTKTM